MFQLECLHPLGTHTLGAFKQTGARPNVISIQHNGLTDAEAYLVKWHLGVMR